MVFGKGNHICPRAGMKEYNVFDHEMITKPKEIKLGVVGISENIELFNEWIEICKAPIIAKENSKQPNLFVSFAGFNEHNGFCSKLITDDSLNKTINKKELNTILSTNSRDDRIDQAVDMYYEAVRFLSQNKNPDVIICLLPKSFENKISKKSLKQEEDKLDEDIDTESLEHDFRRALKAKSMHLSIPIQIIKEHSLKNNKGVQDDATRAWNLCTAIYYKAKGIPWRMLKNENKPSVCYVGIGFYRSRDKQTMQTSLAQIFNELGNGIILRGSPVVVDKFDRTPHLESEQAYELLLNALKEYKIAVENLPARLVLHKSSNFNEKEIEGFTKVIEELGISTYDFLTIQDSQIRLFRDGLYPPYRGTCLELEKNRFLLYTRGSVEYYKTYTGMYIPQPIEIRLFENNESPLTICEEILTLTKMNWNNTQFDRKYPVTLDCARKVGEILKYIPDNEMPQIRYSFYM